MLGLRLSEEPRSTFQRRNTRYRGGMHVDDVRPNSPAATEGILPGDILVGMHSWETASEQDIQYIVSRPNLADMGKVKFYVLRGQNTLYGHLNVASQGRRRRSQSTQRPSEPRSSRSRSVAATVGAWNSNSFAGCASMCRRIPAHALGPDR